MWQSEGEFAWRGVMLFLTSVYPSWIAFIRWPPLWLPPQLLGVLKCRKKDSGFNNLTGCVCCEVRLYSKLLGSHHLWLAAVINSSPCLHERRSRKTKQNVAKLFCFCWFEWFPCLHISWLLKLEEPRRRGLSILSEQSDSICSLCVTYWGTPESEVCDHCWAHCLPSAT